MIRYDWVLWLLVLIVGIALLASSALADPVCPPQRFFCWQVKAAVEMFGEANLEARARACRWPEKKIAEARRCLRK